MSSYTGLIAMPTPIQTLSTTDELERALASSAQQPVVIFKHSPTCGISAQAFELITEWLAAATLTAEVFVLPVQAGRLVSGEIAQRFGIRHESPQVLVINQGRVVWHGSHFRATADGIRAALNQIAA